MPTPTLVEPGDPAALAEAVSAELTRRHGRPPSAVACAPGRVNLIGEHLDYNGGRCLPVALPHATYAAVTTRADRVLTVTSAQLGTTEPVTLDGLRPGAVPAWAAYVAGVLWALDEAGWDVPGADVAVDSRVPLGAGLSSSAALECAVALAMLPVCGVPDSEQVRRTLAAACVRAETEMAGAPTGGMDQAVALHATAGHALLLDFSDGSQRQVPWAPETEGLALLVVDTRVSHALVASEYGARRAQCEAAADMLGVGTLAEARGRSLEAVADPLLRRRARHVLTEMDRVDATVTALERGDHAAVGPLLDESHASLRDDFEVSCVELDVAVEVARGAGALGARMTGGGFGGSAVALVAGGAVEAVMAAVAREFGRRRWPAPGFLLAPASAGARLLT